MTDDETRLDWATDLPNHTPPGGHPRFLRLPNGAVELAEEFREHRWHTHNNGMLSGFPRDDKGNYWHPSVGAPTRHVTSKVYQARKRRTPVQRALMWAAIIVVVAATMAAAVPVAGLACLAYCPVP